MGCQCVSIIMCYKNSQFWSLSPSRTSLRISASFHTRRRTSYTSKTDQFLKQSINSQKVYIQKSQYSHNVQLDRTCLFSGAQRSKNRYFNLPDTDLMLFSPWCRKNCATFCYASSGPNTPYASTIHYKQPANAN